MKDLETITLPKAWFERLIHHAKEAEEYTKNHPDDIRHFLAFSTFIGFALSAESLIK